MTESEHGDSPGEERFHGRPSDQAMPNGDEDTLDERLQFHWYFEEKNGRSMDHVKDSMAGNSVLQESPQRIEDRAEQ